MNEKVDELYISELGLTFAEAWENDITRDSFMFVLINPGDQITQRIGIETRHAQIMLRAYLSTSGNEELRARAQSVMEWFTSNDDGEIVVPSQPTHKLTHIEESLSEYCRIDEETLWGRNVYLYDLFNTISLRGFINVAVNAHSHTSSIHHQHLRTPALVDMAMVFARQTLHPVNGHHFRAWWQKRNELLSQTPTSNITQALNNPYLDKAVTYFNDTENPTQLPSNWVRELLQ